MTRSSLSSLETTSYYCSADLFSKNKHSSKRVETELIKCTLTITKKKIPMGKIYFQTWIFYCIVNVAVERYVHISNKENPFFTFCRQQNFAAFTEEFLAAPFTDQIFHFIIPALADVKTCFPYELFLNALLLTESRRLRKSERAPWLFYVVLTVGETYLGM